MEQITQPAVTINIILNNMLKISINLSAMWPQLAHIII